MLLLSFPLGRALSTPVPLNDDSVAGALVRARLVTDLLGGRRVGAGAGSKCIETSGGVRDMGMSARVDAMGGGFSGADEMIGNRDVLAIVVSSRGRSDGSNSGISLVAISWPATCLYSEILLKRDFASFLELGMRSNRLGRETDSSG